MQPIQSLSDFELQQLLACGDEAAYNELYGRDGLELLGNLYYQDFDRIIMYEKNITPDFFDLKNGMAGEILQKFSNYRVRLAIVGDLRTFPVKVFPNSFMKVTKEA